MVQGSSVPNSSAQPTSIPNLSALQGDQRWFGWLMCWVDLHARSWSFACRAPGGCPEPAKTPLPLASTASTRCSTAPALQQACRHIMRPAQQLSADMHAPVAGCPQVMVCLQESKAEPLDGMQAQQRVQPDLQQGRAEQRQKSRAAAKEQSSGKSKSVSGCGSWLHLARSI